LEQVKHLFSSVKGIVFVLSIDKVQLCHAIRGFYGNDRINAEEYLRRFIDFEYSIPSLSTEKFCEYLYDYYSFDDIFEMQERKKHHEFHGDKELLLKISTILLNGATLRQQEKIYGFTRLIISSFKENQYIFPQLLFVLIYMKMMKPELYNKIRTNNISIQELGDEFENLIPNIQLDTYIINISYIEARLLHFYNNQQDFHMQQTLVEKNEQRIQVTLIKTKLKTERFGLAESLTHIASEFQTRDTKLSYLLDRIDLLSSTGLFKTRIKS
jgi:hypothetical protein